MATINFPTSPVVGQTYKYNPGTPEEKAFIFKAGETGASDGYWKSSIVGGSFGPASAAEINAETESVKYIAPDQLALSDQIDEDKLQVRLEQDAPIWTAGRKNLLINGGFNIWQRGTSLLLTLAGYVADRFASGAGDTMSRSTDVPSGESFVYSCTCDGVIVQGVELPVTGKAGVFQIGNKFKFSFWTKHTGSISVFARFRDDNASITGQDVVHDSVVTGTGVWEKHEVDITIGVAPGATRVCLSVGTTALAFTTGWQLEQVTSNYPYATKFEYRAIAEELALCQRYYWKSLANRGSSNNFTYTHPTTMRVVPVMTSTSGVPVPTSEVYWKMPLGVSIIATVTADAEL